MLRAYTNAHCQAFLLSLRHFRQSILSSTLLVIVIGIAFSLPIVLWLATLNAQSVTKFWPHSTQLSVFMDKSLPADEVKMILSSVRKLPEVAFANFISAQEGLTTLEEQTGMEEVFTLLENNPLPSVIEVHPGQFDKAKINQLFQNLQKVKGVSLVKMDLQWLLRLESMLSLAQKLAVGLMLLLCVAVVLVVGNTIRLAVANRKMEIEVLTLIGATKSYIRRPFLYFGSIYGLLGALFAWLALTFLMMWLQQSVTKIATLYYTHFYLIGLSWRHGLILLFIGAALGFVAAYLSVSFRLNKNEGEYGF